jgi:hypothetical protein
MTKIIKKLKGLSSKSFGKQMMIKHKINKIKSKRLMENLPIYKNKKKFCTFSSKCILPIV